MGLRITGLNEFRERLEHLRAEEVMARALAEQAQRMAERVREGLSETPGAAGHDEPWFQTGALRNSVGAQADGLQATVGSSDPAAMPQELGTSHMPGRPFLAPVAAGMGEEVARAVGAAVTAALRGDGPDASSTDADSDGGGLDGDSFLGGGNASGNNASGVHTNTVAQSAARSSFNPGTSNITKAASYSTPDGVYYGDKINRQMTTRSWTPQEIDDAVKNERIDAINKASGNPATRYVNPQTGKSVIIDDVTNEVVQVGGKDFSFGPASGDKPGAVLRPPASAPSTPPSAPGDAPEMPETPIPEVPEIPELPDLPIIIPEA